MRQPLAIVGMGCRLAGAESLDALWALLMRGGDGFTAIPSDRFDRDEWCAPGGPISSQEGGFITGHREFDARLFGISPREAEVMDPQHRILLEVAHSALQDAGFPAPLEDGVRAGVYVGMFTGDFRERLLREGLGGQDVYTEIGTTRSSAAGRISHAFNLNGPAAAVDAACASSLLAVHLACQSIWMGESEFALAGGCNLILEPDTSTCFARSGMLSPRSRCHFGDAEADGFVRSDGFGVVVIKPLQQALDDNDRVYAVIRSSVCSNDARQGEGLFMTPSTAGQETLLRRAYEETGLDLRQLCYVEAHGTGTRAGDPVECRAIARVLGKDREAPLWLGSVKTNVGHAEGAAGIAGLIKTALILHHRLIPPSLHLKTPNPDIPWEAGNLAIPTAPVALPEHEPLLAGINSFGLSGTDAHVVLGTAPPRPPLAAPTEQDAWILPLSAHTPEALAAQAADLATHLETTGDSVGDIAYTLAHRRLAMPHRRAVVGADAAALAAALAEPVAPVSLSQRGVVFVFSGQGGQWLGMGQALSRHDAAFRAAVSDLDATFSQVAGWSLWEALRDPEGRWMHDIARLQPVLMGTQVAIARTWQAWGIEPDAVVGHSMGEVSAACVSGALSDVDAVRVICTRSRLMRQLRGQGGMAVLGEGAAAAAARIAPWSAELSLAVINSDTSTVISGAPRALQAVLEQCESEGVFARAVAVDVASHSPQTEPLLAALRAGLGGLSPRAAAIPFWSTVHSERRDGSRLDAQYWADNLRCPVRFAETMRKVMAAGGGIFVEANAHPVLLSPTSQLAEAPVLTVPSMKKGADDRLAFLDGAALLWSHGLPVRWSEVSARGSVVSLPVYPFQREEHWPAAAAPRSRAAPSGVSVSLLQQPWLSEHRVREAPILPGAFYVEAALAAAAARWPGAGLAVESVSFQELLSVPSEAPTVLEVSATSDGETMDVVLHSEVEGARCDHASARVRRLAASPAPLLQQPAAHAAVALELQRMSRGHRFAVLSVSAPEARGVAAHLRQRLRDSDAVFWLQPGKLMVLLRGVGHPAHLAIVAARLRDASPTPLRLGGVLVDGAQPLSAAALTAASAAGLPALPAPRDAAVAVDAASFYEEMSRRGIQYGAAFRGVRDLCVHGAVSEAWIDLPVLAPHQHQVHPAILDLCFQAALGGFMLGAGEPVTFLPTRLERLVVRGAPAGPLRCSSWRQPSARADEIRTHFTVTCADGTIFLEGEGLCARRLPVAQKPEHEAWFHRWDWEAVEPEPPRCAEHAGRWLVLDMGGGAEVSAAMRAQGAVCESISPDEPLTLSRCAGVEGVVVAAAEQPALPATGEAALREAARRGAATATLAHQLSATGQPQQLWIVTRGACAVQDDDRVEGMAGAGLWGLARVISRECPDVQVRSIDTDSTPGARLAGVILGGQGEDELAIRDARCFTHRLRACAAPALLCSSPSDAQEAVITIACWAPVSGVDGLVVAGGQRDGAPALVLLTEPPAAAVVAVDPDAVTPLPPHRALDEAVALAAAGLPAALRPAQSADGALLCAEDAQAAAAACAWLLLHEIRAVGVSSCPQVRQAMRDAGAMSVLDRGAAQWVAQARDLTGGVSLSVELGQQDARLVSLLRPGGRRVVIGSQPVLPSPNVETAWVDPVALLAVQPGALCGVLRQLMAAEWVPTAAARAQVRQTQPPLQWDGTWVISGGVGGIGRALARWLAGKGATELVLLSRTGRWPGADPSLQADLMAAGAAASVAACDVADASALRGVLDGRQGLRGVVHLAGLLDDATLAGQDEGKMRAAMRPKIAGAWNLHAQTTGLGVEHFVLFSSAAGALGSPGQGNYAAANAWMDGLAEHRRSVGLPALSVQWGVWREAGLAAERDDRGKRLSERGLGSMASAAALDALERAMSGCEPVMGVFSIDWARWAESYPSVRQSATFSGLLPDEAAAAVASLAALPEAARRPAAQAALKAQLSAVLRIPAGRIGLDEGLASLGLDSLMAVELQVRLKDRLGIELRSSEILHAASLAALIDAVLQTLEATPAAAAAPEPVQRTLDASVRAAAAAPVVTDPGNVLLTGATGFLGVHVLRELLDVTEAHIWCLVRAADPAAGWRRVHTLMQQHDLVKAGDKSRISVAVGDLEQPRLGLGAAQWDALAAKVEVIHHCGAWVNHAMPLSRLEAANVGGVEEILRLAVAGIPKTVHHVSTMAVFPFSDRPGASTCYDEGTALAECAEPFFGGYAESKRLAELLIAQARQRSVSVSVYRVGQITGSHHAARCPAQDAIWRLVQAMIRLGEVPGFASGVSLSPVDFVARSIVELSRLPAAHSQDLHLFNRRQTTAGEVATVLERMGLPLRRVEPAAWLSQLPERVHAEMGLYPLLPALMELDLLGLDRGHIRASCAHTVAMLGPRCRSIMDVDEALLERYLRGLMEQGALPQPARLRQEA